MIDQLLSAGNVLLAQGSVLLAHRHGGHHHNEHAMQENNEEVLPHCPYHPQIDFYHAARDAFLESQGLTDFQEYEVRKEIIDRKKAVAIEEMIYREDMSMFWSGGSRMAHCLMEYMRLYSQLLASDNWSTEYHLLKETNPMTFAMQAWTTWGQVSNLWK